jgi:hypothetical protein
MLRLVYFVGAGLSKALSLPNRPIPAMYDFISTMAHYVYDDVILTTLADLENSEPYPYAFESPEAKRAAQRLVGRWAERTPSLRAEFARALTERPTESIEDLLERSSHPGGNLSAQPSEVRFKYAIRRLFAIIHWELNWAPLLHFLHAQFQITDATHTFVNFNYDLILDRGIQRCWGQGMDFSHCYGFKIPFRVVDEPLADKNGFTGGCRVLPLGLGAGGGLVAILKPQGSLNWLVPADWKPGDRSVIALPLTSSGELRYVQSAETFQWYELPNDVSLDLEPCILTPRTAKRTDRPFLSEVRKVEANTVQSADKIYVIGWSVPKTDEDQEGLIRSNIQERRNPVQSLVAVNYMAGADYYNRVKDIFGCTREAIRVYDSGFVHFSSQL